MTILWLMSRVQGVVLVGCIIDVATLQSLSDNPYNSAMLFLFWYVSNSFKISRDEDLKKATILQPGRKTTNKKKKRQRASVQDLPALPWPLAFWWVVRFLKSCQHQCVESWQFFCKCKTWPAPKLFNVDPVLPAGVLPEPWAPREARRHHRLFTVLFVFVIIVIISILKISQLVSETKTFRC